MSRNAPSATPGIFAKRRRDLRLPRRGPRRRLGVGERVSQPARADAHGHPALANPYAIYFNPAALGGIDGTQIVLDGTLAYRHVTYDRAASALSAPMSLGDPTYVAANTGEGSASNALVIPFLAAASDFGCQVLLRRMGAYVPFGGAVSWDKRGFLARQQLGARSARWSAAFGSGQRRPRKVALPHRRRRVSTSRRRVSLALSGSVIFSSINHGLGRDVER